MTGTMIRPYRGSDETALIALWNAAMTHDRINEIAAVSMPGGYAGPGLSLRLVSLDGQGCGAAILAGWVQAGASVCGDEARDLIHGKT
jgi:hypothetical protein